MSSAERVFSKLYDQSNIDEFAVFEIRQSEAHVHDVVFITNEDTSVRIRWEDDASGGIDMDSLELVAVDSL